MHTGKPGLSTLLVKSGVQNRWELQFRAISRAVYEQLGMKDRTWGWTVEMQVLALMRRLRIQEVPVSWDRRLAGVSKISGTVSGVIRAGGRILWTIGYYAACSRDSATLGKAKENIPS